MHRLIYYSANRMEGSSDEVRQQIGQILQTSRRNNAKVDITGALVFSHGFFGQVLEGPQAALEATFERIQRDIRHGDVSLLEFAPATTRSFDNWSMAFVGHQSSALNGFEGLGIDAGYDDKKMSGEKLLRRLVELVQSETV